MKFVETLTTHRRRLDQDIALEFNHDIFLLPAASNAFSLTAATF